MSYHQIDILNYDCYIYNPHQLILHLEVFFGPGSPPDQQKNYAPLFKGIACAVFCFRKTLEYIRYPNFYLGTVKAKRSDREFYLRPLGNIYTKKQTYLLVEKGKVPTLKDICIAKIIHVVPGRPNNAEIGKILEEQNIPGTLRADICENPAFIFNVVIDSYYSYMKPCFYCYRKTKKTRKLASHKGNMLYFEGEERVVVTEDEDELFFISAQMEENLKARVKKTLTRTPI
jgi:hypothetical protein